MAIYYPSPGFAHIYPNPQDSQSIKAAGNVLKTSAGCSKCRRLESDTMKLMKCAKCKLALYCSKKCQTGDWLTHKFECATTADQKLHAITDLLNLFLGNKFLHSYLELALILELGLEPISMPDRLFTAQFYIGIEPCNINNFHQLWSPYFDFDPSEKVKMKGMFQLLGLTASSAHPHNVPSACSRFTPDLAEIQREVNERGHEGDALVQCEFVVMADNFVSTRIFVISITSGAFLLAKQFREITVSKGINKPLTVATCLEFINMHIRQDAENQLRLRTRMKVDDIKFINYTWNDINTCISTKDLAENWEDVYKRTLKEKVNRESIYSA